MASQKFTSGEIYVTGSLHGSGANLTSNTVPRAALAYEAGSPGYVLVNNGSGVVSSVNFLPLAHGGTAATLSAEATYDNVLALPRTATAASLIRYSQNNSVANSLVQRDANGFFSFYNPLTAPVVAGAQFADAVGKSTDTAPFYLFTIPTSPNYVTMIDLNVVAITATGGSTFATQMMWRGKNIAGTVSADPTFVYRSQWADIALNTASVTVTTTGVTNLYVTCVGMSATTIQWFGHINVYHKSAVVDT